METQKTIDWMNEEKLLGSGDVLFNKALKVDTPYNVTFLDEGRAFTETYEGVIRDKIVFKIRVTGGGVVGEDMSWYITKTKRRDSLFGMLATLFARAGQAKGLTLNVAATGTSKDRRYSVKEYADLVFGKTK